MRHGGVHGLHSGGVRDGRRIVIEGVTTVAATVCAAAVIVSLLSRFVTDGGTKKLLSLVMGAFLTVCMILPVKNAVAGFTAGLPANETETAAPATVDEAYNRQLLSLTRGNLETALQDILLQNGVTIHRAEVVLALQEGNRIIISSVTVYIDEETAAQSDTITRVTEENFSVRPQIITENTG